LAAKIAQQKADEFENLLGGKPKKPILSDEKNL
jgi:hypothetical protein